MIQIILVFAEMIQVRILTGKPQMILLTKWELHVDPIQNAKALPIQRLINMGSSLEVTLEVLGESE
jgi:hypothetical protein